MSAHCRGIPTEFLVNPVQNIPVWGIWDRRFLNPPGGFLEGVDFGIILPKI